MAAINSAFVVGSTQNNYTMLVAHQITTLKATVCEALLKDLHTTMSTSVLSFPNANGKNKQTNSVLQSLYFC